MDRIMGQPFLHSVNGTRLNVQLDGPAGAPWMVFSNSLSANISLWDEQAAAFGDRFRFLRYDQRGHGRSEVPAAGFTMDDLATDLLGLLDDFAVNNAVLVGVSMGATTVMRCAARAPERCAGVVACDGQWRSAPGSAAMWNERFAVAREQGMEALAEPTVRRWFQPGFFTRKPEVVERIKKMIAGTSVEGYIQCGTALQDFDFRADYPGLTVPALFVAGEHDGDIPAVMREMHQATRGSGYTVIGHCGHLPNIEQPEKLYEAMDGFVRTLGLG
ncbi:Alpha/beta hydrolase [uncultured delta proteobacterium]|uniref:Alpha/beta hydrolase n=1 Tax=uncultured delta proteobacterium TaxID=34034 RepID=A0A212J9Z7_9DELT|nr:Alpha/beta hydrolase [uncultured delta proteobacterium]